MISSGETATTTSGDTAVTLLTIPAVGSTTSERFSVIDIVNEGAVAGFYSIDGGTVWARLPATSAVHVDVSRKPIAPGTLIKVKRISGGTDLASVYGSAT